MVKCLIARAQMGFSCDKKELKTLVQKFVVANEECDDSGSFIFNADESGFPQDLSPMRGIEDTSQQVLACISASGDILPPLIVHKGQSVQEWVSPQPYPATMHAATPPVGDWKGHLLFTGSRGCSSPT
ncbi:hypothetical protein PR048_005353 [Dryococelus australis]|uniref:Uncharacterized protein n=1 Tax=Dryococelus australis TaxID=614101 RepID=A0ABQ9I7Y0_9NEOP|nr:hypothetical protein PR048_005353 [Dryococelus australis]